jgi:hypothetical protein
VAVIVIALRVEGLSEHETVYEFARFAALFLQPGNTLPAEKKVIRPATEEVIEITLLVYTPNLRMELKVLQWPCPYRSKLLLRIHTQLNQLLQ